MTETTLVKLGYGKIDKLCDATFVRKIFKSTKKNFALFVSENQDIQEFLTSLEERIEETNSEYQDMIHEYIESISEDVNSFKLRLKEIEREKKQKEKDRQKQLIKEEILREMEAEKKKMELESKLGIKKPVESDIDDEENGIKTKLKLKPKPRNVVNTQEIMEKIIEETKESSHYADKDIDLGLFYKFLQQAIKNDLLIIKNDKGRMTIRDVDLDEDKIRIKVE